ncbi:MAG: UDP-N-acetylglucosamine 1-carboxyvinyltransferase [Acidobacteriota bacterium]
MNNFRIMIRGKKDLKGEISVSGAKNASLPELAATILTPEKCELTNIPDVKDIKTMINALENIGASGNFKSNKVDINLSEIKTPVISKLVSETSRSSILILGPLLARYGYAKVSLPGGCDIGDRKIDFHLEGLKKMGAVISIEDGYIIAKSGGLTGTSYTFPSKSVTGTENLLMAATLARGETVLKNCAVEPEIADLIDFLVSMGARIEGKDRDILHITGMDMLNGSAHKTIPDRIEMGTYVIAACFRGNDIVVKNCVPGFISSLLDILENIGVNIEIKGDEIHVRSGKKLSGVDVVTEPYPGFPTDLQAQLTTFLTQIEGRSTIRERIFNNRFKHVIELNKLGANIEINGDQSVINGRSELKGAYLKATDLRASASLVLGGLIAEGETRIDNSYQLFRGYENMPEKLNKIGADIKVMEV